MTNMQAAVGLAQLEQLDSFITTKRKMGQLYNKLLNHSKMFKTPTASTEYAENIYWAYGIVLSEKCQYDAEQVIHILKERKIGSRPFFYPMHKQPVFNDRKLFLDEVHPNSDNIASRGLYLPSGLALTRPLIEYVSKVLLEILESVFLETFIFKRIWLTEFRDL